MSKYKLELLMPAQCEMDEIALRHLKLVGQNSARNILKHIYSSLEALLTHPQLGIAVDNKFLRQQGYRKLICGNYLCFYRLIGDTIFVYHVLDGRSDYPRLLSDLPE
jgi:plasmid stabilization system protein ParE